jgi:hypothetical protein
MREKPLLLEIVIHTSVFAVQIAVKKNAIGA